MRLFHSALFTPKQCQQPEKKSEFSLSTESDA